LNPGLSHPTSVPMSSTCQKRRCDEDPEIVSLTRRVGRIRSSRGYGNTISFDKARSRATLDENIYCAGWSVSWLYQRSLARLLAGATQHDVEKLLPYANSLPEGIEGRRRGFVQTNDDSSQRVFFSQRFSSPSFFLPFIRSFCPFVVHRLSSFSVRGQWMPIRWCAPIWLVWRGLMDAPGISGLRSARDVQREKSQFKSATRARRLDIPDDDDEEEAQTFDTNDRRPIVSETPNHFDIVGNTGPGPRIALHSNDQPRPGFLSGLVPRRGECCHETAVGDTDTPPRDVFNAYRE